MVNILYCSNKYTWSKYIMVMVMKFSNALADRFPTFKRKFQLGTSLGQPKQPCCIANLRLKKIYVGLAQPKGQLFYMVEARQD